MAQIDFIRLQKDQSAAIEAQDMAQTIAYLRLAYEGLLRNQARMRHLFNDGVSPIDWTGVEQKYGLNAGEGVRLFTFVDGSILAMTNGQQNSACKDLMETVG